MEKMLYILLLFIVCANIETKAQSLINEEDYNDLSNWSFLSKAFRAEKNDKENAFQVFYYYKTMINWFDKAKSETFDISATIAIPQDRIHFSFDCNSMKLDSLLLKITLYERNEEFLKQLIYPLNMNSANKISFENADATLMEVQIYGKSMLRYDSIELKVTDFKVSTSHTNLSQEVKKYQSRMNSKNAVPLSLIYNLDEFKNKKIIGLGESIHGSRSIQQQKNNIIERLCEDGNLKLICFENRIDAVMNWDLYIQGILPESYLDKIKEDQADSFYEVELTVGLLNKLREINSKRKAEDRIHVVGLDYREKDFYVFEYFQAWRERGKNKKMLDDILLKMDTLKYNHLGLLHSSITGRNVYSKSWRDTIPAEKKYSSLIKLLKNNGEFRKMMDEKDFRFLTESFSLEIPTSHDAHESDSVKDERDDYMWKILQLAIDCYAPAETDKVIIDAHSLHVSRTYNTYSSIPLFAKKDLGVYISDSYGNDYLAISLHVGKGRYKTYSIGMTEGIAAESDLQEPLADSFEWAADKTNMDTFYSKVSDLDMDTIYTFRSIASIATWSQFYPLTKSRFDGYIYIDESIACTPVPYDEEVRYYRERRKTDYIDSLVLVHTPYTSFNYFIYTGTDYNVEVFPPKDFGWKEVPFALYYGGNLGYAGVFLGFFESRDKNCIVILDNMKFPKPIQRLSSTNKTPFIDKREIITEAENSFLNKNFVPKGSLDKTENSQKAEKRLNYRSEAYAKQAFNADKVAEASLIMSPKDRLHIFGAYNHGEAILIEKDGGTINLKCFYTDKGYKNKEKYRKAIESLVRFK